MSVGSGFDPSAVEAATAFALAEMRDPVKFRERLLRANPHLRERIQSMPSVSIETRSTITLEGAEVGVFRDLCAKAYALGTARVETQTWTERERGEERERQVWAGFEPLTEAERTLLVVIGNALRA